MKCLNIKSMYFMNNMTVKKPLNLDKDVRDSFTLSHWFVSQTPKKNLNLKIIIVFQFFPTFRLVFVQRLSFNQSGFSEVCCRIFTTKARI